VKFLGHPVHPILVVFPIGLLITAVGFDLAYAFTQQPGFAFAAFWCMLVGVALGVLAGLVGLLDWFNTKPKSRSRRVGAWHGLGNLAVELLFAYSLYLRQQVPGFIPTGSAPAFAYAGAALLLVTGWLGGELVYRLGEAVDKGAHPNAPSSLTAKKARR
jgi:uncharacterized membrane protein